MAQLVYELSFKGAASAALAAAFECSQLTTQHGITTIRAELDDQAALQGVIGRIHALNLELLEVRLIAEPVDDDLRMIEGP